MWHLKKRDKATIYKATSWNLAIVKVLRFEGILGCMCRTKAWKICCLIMLKLSSTRYVGKAVEFVEYLMSFHEYPRYQCPQFTDLPYFPESRITQITAQQPRKRNQNCHQQFSSAIHTLHTLHTPPVHLKMEIIKLNWQDPSAACGRNFDNHKRIPAHTLPLQTFQHSNLQLALFSCPGQLNR